MGQYVRFLGRFLVRGAPDMDFTVRVPSELDHKETKSLDPTQE